jgi:hypothetical protein
MSEPIASARLVRRFGRHQLRQAIAFAIVAVALGGAGCYLTAGTVTDARASYDAERVDVVDETTTRQLRGSRRSKHWEDVRAVTVEFDDGTSRVVASDDLAVGSTATVYLGEDGEVHEEEPDGPGFWWWVLDVVLFLIAVPTAFVAAVTARSVHAVRRVDPSTAPRLQLRVTAVEDATVGKKVLRRMTTTVVRSSSAHTAVGDVLVVSSRPGHVGTLSTSDLDAVIARDYELGPVLVLRGLPDGDWWAAETSNESGKQRLLDA